MLNCKSFAFPVLILHCLMKYITVYCAEDSNCSFSFPAFCCVRHSVHSANGFLTDVFLALLLIHCWISSESIALPLFQTSRSRIDLRNAAVLPGRCCTARVVIGQRVGDLFPQLLLRRVDFSCHELRCLAISLCCRQSEALQMFNDA